MFKYCVVVDLSSESMGDDDKKFTAKRENSSLGVAWMGLMTWQWEANKMDGSEARPGNGPVQSYCQ